MTDIRQFFSPIVATELFIPFATVPEITEDANLADEADEAYAEHDIGIDIRSCTNIGYSIGINDFPWLKYGHRKGKKMLQVCSICEGKDVVQGNRSKGFCEISYKQTTKKLLIAHQNSQSHKKHEAALSTNSILEKMLSTELSKEVNK